MKSPGTSSAAAIIKCDQLTWKPSLQSVEDYSFFFLSLVLLWVTEFNRTFQSESSARSCWSDSWQADVFLWLFHISFNQIFVCYTGAWHKFLFFFLIQPEPSASTMYSWFQATSNRNDTHFSPGHIPPSFNYFSLPDDSLTRMIFHVAWPWSLAGVIIKRWQHTQTDVAGGRHGFAEKTGFWAGEMKWLPAEHGDQSIKDQAQTAWGEEEEEEERDTLISVEPALTLMVASRGPGASSRDLFQLD